MNTFNLGRITTRPAVSAVLQWHVVKETATGVLHADAGEPVTGVARYDTAAGAGVSVIVDGDIPVKASGVILPGAQVVADDDGFVKSVVDADPGDTIIGFLTNGTSAAAEGDEVVMTLQLAGQTVVPEP